MAGAVGIALAIWGIAALGRRHAGADGVRPKMTPWSKLPLVEVSHRLGGRVRVRAPFRLGPMLTHVRFDYTLPGGNALAEAIVAAARAQPGAQMVRLAE